MKTNNIAAALIAAVSAICPVAVSSAPAGSTIGGTTTGTSKLSPAPPFSSNGASSGEKGSDPASAGRPKERGMKNGASDDDARQSTGKSELSAPAK